MTAPVTSKSANGVSGHLLSRGDGTYFFRVYNYDDGSFIDYAIFHSDLFVTIEDSDAFFYNKDSGLYHDVLDHSPSTLGIDSNDQSLSSD
jgi:hypothetical protein